MRILLLGNTGQLGWELQRCLQPLGEVRALGRPEIDLANAQSLRAIIRANRPEAIVNATAYNAVDLAESKSDLARNALMVHVYGRFVFEQLVANRLWKLTRRIEREDSVKYSMEGVGVKLDDSSRPAFIQAFGKNTCDLKVWMPRELKDAVDSLGFDAGQTVSEYMRRALTAYYLGRTIMDPLRG